MTEYQISVNHLGYINGCKIAFGWADNRQGLFKLQIFHRICLVWNDHFSKVSMYINIYENINQKLIPDSSSDIFSVTLIRYPHFKVLWYIFQLWNNCQDQRGGAAPPSIEESWLEILRSKNLTEPFISPNLHLFNLWSQLYHE